jgi:hypothetical protein
MRTYRTMPARCCGIKHIVEFFCPALTNHVPALCLPLSHRLPALSTTTRVAHHGRGQLNVGGPFQPTSLSPARARPPQVAYVARQYATLSLVSNLWDPVNTLRLVPVDLTRESWVILELHREIGMECVAAALGARERKIRRNAEEDLFLPI